MDSCEIFIVHLKTAAMVNTSHVTLPQSMCSSETDDLIADRDWESLSMHNHRLLDHSL